jgi:hypothetical protein
MDIADVGRANGFGDGARPVLRSGERVREDGCWRTVKTNVLLRARFAHWGCAT